MKKIDVKKALNERVRNTEWTDANTWNVLRKIRNTKAARREFSLRRLMPAAVALLLVMGIGITALTRTPGGPDPIRENDQYTAQPLVTALSGGQGEGTGDLPEEAVGCEDSLLPVNLGCERQGIRVDVVAGLAAGNESYVKYAIQDIENKYPGLEMEPEKMINTILPEDCDADGTMYADEIMTCDVNVDEPYRNMYIIGNHHSRKIQGEDQEITLGIRDMRIMQRTDIDLHPYIQEYAKPEEGISREGYKILDPEKKLSIPLGREDLLLTGIGWIDNQLHVRIEYTGESFVKNVTSYDNVCDVWISGDLIHPTETRSGVDYTMLTSGTTKYEEILDCGPDNYGEVSLIAHCSVLEDVVQGNWSVNLPLSMICPEIEPAVDAAEAVREQMEINYPGITDQLRPINLSCENDGIRLELISGVVKGNEAWAVYSLQDVEGRYSGSEISGYPGFSSVMGDVDSGESPLLYTDEKEHKQYFCAHEVYEQPVDPADRLVYFGMSHYEAERKVMLDLLDLLKEHGTTQEGVLSPELAPISTTEGEVPRNKMKILDYTKPLDVPVLDDVKLTGVGWIDGSVHVQFHNPNAHGFGGERVSASGNWSTYLFYDWDYDTEDLYDLASWDENGDGSIDWEERILNCTPELLEKLQPTVEVSVTDALVEGDWEIRFPLRMICADTTDQMDEYLELLEKNAEVCEVVENFLRDWAKEDFSDMYLFTDDGWRTSVYMGENRLRTLAASGSVVNYLFDSISGETGDAERTAVCTVKMLLPGEEEPVYRRYEIRVRKDQENGRYAVDPACLEHWEQGEDLSGYPLPSISDIAFGDSVPYKGNKQMVPVNLSSEKQGIRMNVLYGIVNGQEAAIIYSLEDPEGRYAGFPDEPVLTHDIGSVSANNRAYLHRSEKDHKAYYMQYIDFDQPVTPEDRTVTLKMESVKVTEKDQADLTQMLKQYAKAADGVEPPQLAQAILGARYTGPTKVPDLKVLDYTKPLDLPLFGNVTLGNIGWIDGKLHVQLHTDSPNVGGFEKIWLNTFLDGNTDTLWKELDYSPLEWYGDNGSWYEFVYDYAPEDLDKLEMTLNAICEAKTLEDDWTVSFPLSMICAEDKPAAEEPKVQTGELLNESYNFDGTEVQLHAVDRSFEKQGMCVNVIGGLVKGNEFWVKYSVQDLENKYSGLEMFPEAYINTVCPEDGMSTGEVVPERAVVITSSLDTDKVSHTSTFLTQFIHSQTIQDKGQEITFGLKDLKFTRHTTVDLHKYVEEYAKPEEGELSRTYNGQKILNTSEKLNIPMGRDDVLLTGIGWIDNKLHARFEYTDEGDFLKNGKSYGQACNVWISGEYLDSAKKQESGVAYTMLTGSDKAGATPNRFEEILECAPDNYNEVSLRAHIEVIEDAVQDEWAVSFPLNTIYEGNEPAETAAAETNEEGQDAIRGRVNEILTCWQQKDIDGLLAMCTEPWRSERTQLNKILGKRVPEVWQITDIEGEGWPAATVECEIRMQSESDAGFYFIKMKKEADGRWYFEPAGLGDGTSVYSASSTIRDEDVILSVNETGSIVKAEEIPPFVSRINEFYTCWNKSDLDGMLALCPPNMRNAGYANFMIYLKSLPGTPQEWKIGHLYGKPEDDIRGASCEAVHLWPNGSRIMNYADIVVRKEADGQWYIIPASIDEIANRYADSAEGMPPVPTDEWHTILADRLDEFLTFWQKKDKDGLLALCTTPWRSEWDRLNQLLENRTPQNWEIKWVQESGLPVVTVGCSISMQSEEEDGFFRFTAKKGTDGVWYFEPHEMWDTKVSVASPYSITDRDLILTGNEKGFQAKVEEIPPFVYSIMDFMTLWNEGNAKGMLSLCQPSGRDERLAQIVAAMVTDGDKPIEWKIGQLYGAPEEDARGAACELTIRRRDGQEIVYPVDITAIKEATGKWYLSYRSVEQISSDMLSAHMKTAEEENNRKNNPDNEEIINTLNEFYSCWMNNDKEGMQARGVPGEDDRDYKSLMDTLLDLGLPQAFYPGEIRETGAENTRSLHGSASFRTPEGEDVAYYVDFVVEKADDGHWYVRPEITWSLMHVVELQEATADGQETRKLAWPITVSMELSADRLAGSAPVNVDISVTNTSGRKLEESVRLFDQTMTQIEAFGASGLDAGETRTWSGEYTVTSDQLAEGKVLFFLYFSEYNESTEEFEKHLVSFYRPVFREEAPAAGNASVTRSGRPVRVDMELGKDKLSGPETIDVTISVTNVSGDTLAGPVILYDPDGNQVAEYSEADFAAGETKEWTGKWTVTEAQLAEGKVGFSVKYSDYREGTTELMAHKLTFSKPITKE